MYCLLGGVSFELLHAPSSFNESHQSTFAEHATIEGKPKLQATGNALIVYDLTVKLHHILGDVNFFYQQLLEAQASQKAQALIFGRSDFKGYFVITQINSTTLFTDQNGGVLARDLVISLKEFVGETSDDILGAALQLSGMSPIGSILPTGLINTTSQLHQLLTKAVKTYRSVARIVYVVRSTFTTIRKIIDNPALVLSYLPPLLNGLSTITRDIQWLIVNSNSFTSVETVLKSAQSFIAYMKRIFDDFNSIYVTLQDVFNGGYQDDSWLVWSSNKIEMVDEVIDVLAPVTSKMNAWIALRDDEVTYEPTLS